MTNEQLVKRHQNGEDVFGFLLENNMGAINKYAHKYSCCSLLEKDDLINDFIFVLWKCANSYDFNKNVSFITMFINSMRYCFLCEIKRLQYKQQRATISYNVEVSRVDGTTTELIDLVEDEKSQHSDVNFLKEYCEQVLEKNKVRKKTQMVTLEYLFSDKTHKEIGESYGISSQAISSQVRAIKKILQDDLEKNWL